MARPSKRNEGTNQTTRASPRRAWGLAARAGLLFVLVIQGCASIDADLKRSEAASQVDIFVLTTDRPTADEVIRRLQGVENQPASQSGEEVWSRGHLEGVRDGSAYTILVGQAGGQDDASTKAIMWKATREWRPRYILVLGTALAVANEAPLGAVGIVRMTCDFDLDRFNEMRETGNCHRSDGGLFAAALSIADEWKAAADIEAGRAGCSSARVMKIVALSGNGDPGPKMIETVTKLSEEMHRGLIMEREGIFAAKAVEDLRHEMREPIGFLMIRGVSEIRDSGWRRDDDPAARESEQRLRQEACAAHDTADFAVELIRQRWPVTSRAKH